MLDFITNIASLLCVSVLVTGLIMTIAFMIKVWI